VLVGPRTALTGLDAGDDIFLMAKLAWPALRCNSGSTDRAVKGHFLLFHVISHLGHGSPQALSCPGPLN
ncbi:MAG: hypothetical protein ACT6Q3_17270, partial [Sphingopyxis sp.]